MKKNIIFITTLLFLLGILGIVLYLFIGTFMIVKYDSSISDELLENLERLNITLEKGEYLIYEDHIEYFTIEKYKGLTKVSEQKITYRTIEKSNFYFNKYFREKLGIVFYPIDMVINFMERLENLSSQEPSITVPDIKEPFSRTSFY